MCYNEQMKIPSAYIVSKFHQYCPKSVQNSRFINGPCPICREGDSFGKKKRLFYFFKDDYLYCHNCGTNWNPYWWIKQVTGMSFKQIRDEVMEYCDEDILYEEKSNVEDDYISQKFEETPPLPDECVNIMDLNQMIYYKDHFIVKKGIEYIKSRRLDTALYRPKTFYICINDKYHKNRLIIPYFDQTGKIETYSSRKLLDSDKKAKYLLKFNTPKLVFNATKLDADFPYVFPIEGQIDAMFLKNAVGISGTDLTEQQNNIINMRHPFHKKIWVFDNYRFEGDEVKKKIKEKLKKDETVFLYDDEFQDSKDLNEYCTKNGLDAVDPSRLLKSCFTGRKGLLKLGS